MISTSRPPVTVADAWSVHGAVKVKQRTTTADLWFAVEWLEAFETDDPEEVKSLAAVADKLRREALRRF